MKNRLQIQVASTFSCHPLESALRQSLSETGIAADLEFVAFTQMSELMLAASPDSAGDHATLVLLRLEDWLRDPLESKASGATMDAWVRQELRARVEEFVQQLAILSRLQKQVWFLACPSNGWICGQHNLTSLCRTFANLVLARVRNLPGITVLTWPSFPPGLEIGDREADRLRQTPFTDDAYQQLAAILAQQLAQTLTPDDGQSRAGGGSDELSTYLAGLKVCVRVFPATDTEHHHVDHILRAVASFSLTGEKPTISDAEVDQALNAEGCLLISVSDRVSDYGPSGLITFRSDGDCLLVESMALSCVVLGKQVEYAALSALARLAAERKLAAITFEYQPSGRNQPMLAFLQRIADRQTHTRYVLPTAAAEERIRKASVNPDAWTVTP